MESIDNKQAAYVARVLAIEPNVAVGTKIGQLTHGQFDTSRWQECNGTGLVSMGESMGYAMRQAGITTY